MVGGKNISFGPSEREKNIQKLGLNYFRLTREVTYYLRSVMVGTNWLLRACMGFTALLQVSY